MLLVYLLIFLSPLFFLVVVVFAIGVAGARAARTGKRAYGDLRPYVDNLQKGVANAQQKGMDFANRGTALSKSFEEIAGRWAFIGQALHEATSSPVVKLAGMAGRFASERRSGS